MANSVWAGVSDERLVEVAQSGDHPAFAELVERHRTACFRVALSILRCREDAEDEIQNAFWKAFQHIEQFQRDARFSTWLTRIVVNQCLMRIRRDRRAKMVYIDDLQVGTETITLDLPAQEESVEDTLAKKEVSGVIDREMRRIPPLLRNVFVLRDVQRLPMPEVANRLGISIPAAKSRLLRARSELRTRLEKYQGRLGTASLVAP